MIILSLEGEPNNTSVCLYLYLPVLLSLSLSLSSSVCLYLRTYRDLFTQSLQHRMLTACKCCGPMDSTITRQTPATVFCTLSFRHNKFANPNADPGTSERWYC